MPSRRSLREEIELRELLEEQEYDDRYGQRCWPERSGTQSLDQLAEVGVQVDQDGNIAMRYQHSVLRQGLKRTSSQRSGIRPRPGNQCQLHGPEDKRRTAKGHAYCAACQRERQSQWRASMRVHYSEGG